MGTFYRGGKELSSNTLNYINYMRSADQDYAERSRESVHSAALKNIRAAEEAKLAGRGECVLTAAPLAYRRLKIFARMSPKTERPAIYERMAILSEDYELGERLRGRAARDLVSSLLACYRIDDAVDAINHVGLVDKRCDAPESGIVDGVHAFSNAFVDGGKGRPRRFMPFPVAVK